MAGSGRRWNCAGKLDGAVGPCVGPATRLCGSCGAVSYCSRSHQEEHWKTHREDCAQMAEEMACADHLNDFPFAFKDDVTRLVDLGFVTPCSFMKERHLHLKGLWHGECECECGSECECKTNAFPSPFRAGWELPTSMSPCREPAQPSGRWLTDWVDYYSWRNISMESPVAILLHWTLSLYYALGLAAKRLQESGRRFGSSVRIHYLGPDKEAFVAPVFGELMALIPGTKFYIDMIGPAVSVERDGEVMEIADYPKCLDYSCECQLERSSSKEENKKTSVQVQLWRGLYHDRFSDLAPADIVVAPNAGLNVYLSWVQTMKLLSTTGTPTFITDYSKGALDISARNISLVHSEPLTHSVQPNPFRQPFSHPGKVLNVPTFSNGFIFGFN